VTPAQVTQKALRVLNGILDELKRQAPQLMADSTGQTGNLIRSIAAFHEAVVETYKEVQEQPLPTSAATAEKSAEDPLKAALEAWRAGSESDLKALKQ
jgi:hypothetical protein